MAEILRFLMPNKVTQPPAEEPLPIAFSIPSKENADDEMDGSDSEEVKSEPDERYLVSFTRPENWRDSYTLAVTVVGRRGGADGRHFSGNGFVHEHNGERYVVTAAANVISRCPVEDTIVHFEDLCAYRQREGGASSKERLELGLVAAHF